MVHVGRYMSDEQRAARKEKLRLAQRAQRKRKDRRRPSTPQQSSQSPQSESNVLGGKSLQAPALSPSSPPVDVGATPHNAGSRLATVQEAHSTADSADVSEQHALP